MDEIERVDCRSHGEKGKAVGRGEKEIEKDF
jgi:hypothetical protein